MALPLNIGRCVGAIVAASLLAGCEHDKVADDNKPVITPHAITVAPSQGAVAVSKADRYDIYKVIGKANSRTPENVYNRFKVDLDLGESKVNETDRAALYARFLAYFAKNTDSAVITVKAGANPDLPAYFVQKTADKFYSKPYSDYVITSSKRIFPDEVMSVALQLKSGSKLESTVVQKGVAAAGIIFDVIAHAPGTKVIERIPKDAAKDLDTFISAMGTTDVDLNPSFSITGSSLVDDIHYEILYYDKPKADPSRAAIAKLVIRPEDFRSRYGIINDGRFASVPKPNAVRSKSIDDKSPMDIIKSDESLYRDFLKAETYDQYLDVCERVVNVFGKSELTDVDQMTVLHATVLAINGGGAARNKKRECPRFEDRQAMYTYGLDTLPIDSAPITWDEANKFFDEFLKDVVARKDVRKKIKGNIVVQQDTALLPGIDVGKPVELGNDELSEALSKSGITRYSDYDFNTTKLGGTSFVRTSSKRYKLFLELAMEAGKPRVRSFTIKGA